MKILAFSPRFLQNIGASAYCWEASLAATEVPEYKFHNAFLVNSPPRSILSAPPKPSLQWHPAWLISSVSVSRFPYRFALTQLTYNPDSALGFFLVSGLITIVRIALRLQKRMFWWDDFWAVVALASFTTFVPGKSNLVAFLASISHTPRCVHYCRRSIVHTAHSCCRLLHGSVRSLHTPSSLRPLTD